MTDRSFSLEASNACAEFPISRLNGRRSRFQFAIQILLMAGLLVGARTAMPAEDADADFHLPPVMVTAQKEAGDIQTTPISVTPVTKDILEGADLRSVKDASLYVPNIFINEFSVRALSNPFFRGVHGSPLNPGVTTFVDSVPQLNGYSSSMELVDIEQIEFVRGPQGTLFGRNTVGGLIILTSRRPALDAWRYSLEGRYGDYDFRDVRQFLSGPFAEERLGFSLAAGYSERDGYTVNDATGNTLDSREAFFGKVQLLWVPSDSWDARLIVSGEQARDGDYALGDLDYLRARPYHVSRDFEGSTERDIFAPTLLMNRRGSAVDFSLTAGLVQWKTRDETDLDYTLYSSGTRKDNQDDLQFTTELRLASAGGHPVDLGDTLKLKWQTGLLLFTQKYEQDAVNSFYPGGLYRADQVMPGFPPFDSAANSRHSPQSRLDDRGVGAYGQTTLTIRKKLDVIFGLRADYESKKADLNTFYETQDPILPIFGISTAPTSLRLEKSFTDVTPQAALAYHVTPDAMVYGSISRGYRAGGFNPLSPEGGETYDPETSLNYELGIKTAWFENRLSANFAFFYIDWQELQLNLPMNTVDQQYYIANSGEASSKGAEVELNARPMQNWDIFAGFGYTDAKFSSGATAMWNNSAVPVGGNRLIYTPEYTAAGGTQYAWKITSGATLYTRAEMVAYSSYHYNAVNTASQDAYSLVNFRAGVHGARWKAEAWVKNAFDTEYIPIALEYGAGRLVGESGAPRTFGMRVWVDY